METCSNVEMRNSYYDRSRDDNIDPALGLQKATARVLWVINQQICVVKYQKNL